MKKGTKPDGYKEPKKGKYCPKCHLKVACAYQTCPCCGHAFVNVKTTRIIQKPAVAPDVTTLLDKALEMFEKGLKFEQIEKLILACKS